MNPNLKKKMLSFSVLVLPWVSALFLGKKNILLFLPSATFIGYFFALFSEIADKKRLWKVKNGLFPHYVLDVSYLYGLFPVVTIWILKLTYRNFFKYLMTNIVVDFIFSFYIVEFFERVGTFKFKRMKHSHFFIISVLLSIIIYVFQKLTESIINKEKVSKSH